MKPGAEEHDDAALLRGAARGDEAALAALYDRHAGWLTVRMSRRCAMSDVVDHALQDTFLAGQHTGHARRSRRSWLRALPLLARPVTATMPWATLITGCLAGTVILAGLAHVARASLTALSRSPAR